MGAAPTTAPLVLIYLAVGAGCAFTFARRAHASRCAVSPADIALLLLLWPLVAPFGLRPGAAAPPAPALPADSPARPLLQALARVANAPLAPLLPDEATVRRLAHHLARVSARLDELDQVLARSELDLDAATARRDELAAAGVGDDLLAGAALRVQGVQRLHAMRGRLAREHDELVELFSQLGVQVELVRFAGAAEGGARAVLGELVARVDALAQMLDAEASDGARLPAAPT